MCIDLYQVFLLALMDLKMIVRHDGMIFLVTPIDIHFLLVLQI